MGFYDHPTIPAYTLEFYTDECTVCGNGFREAESCDGEDLGVCPLGPCTASCTCPFGPQCGNLTIQEDLGEQCDDGNQASGDGCSSSCELEIRELSSCGDYVASGAGYEDVEHFTFTLASTQKVTLETGDGAGGCPADTLLTVRFPYGDEIAADFSSGIGGCSRLLLSLEAGMYRATVEDANGGTLPPYVLEFVTSDCSACGNGVLEAEHCDDGNTADLDGCDSDCEPRIPLPQCGSYSNDASGADTFVQFSFVLDAWDAVELETSDGVGGCPGDTYLWLTDSQGTQIAVDTDGGTGLCSRLRAELPAGRYTVGMHGPVSEAVLEYFTGACSVCGNGRIEIEECDDGNTLDGDGCESDCTRVIPLIACTATRSLGIEPQASETFAFALVEAGRVLLETSNGSGQCPGDTSISLFAENGVEVAADEDGGIGRCSRLNRELLPGGYRLEVRSYDQDSEMPPYVLGFTTTACSTCANGVLEAEECDDGNTSDGDGCDSSCAREVLELSACGTYSGAGSDSGEYNEFSFELAQESDIRLQGLAGTEGCANSLYFEVYESGGEYVTGDVTLCTPFFASLPPGRYTLFLSSYYDPELPPFAFEFFTSECSTCGNGTVEAELCDDGNSVDSDGCDTDCLPSLPGCGEHTIDPADVTAPAILLKQRQDIRLEVDGPCYLLSGIALLDEQGNVVVESSGSCPVIRAKLGPGRYEVALDAFTYEESYVLRYFNESCSDCGNEIVEAEECDDGNTMDGDGCDATCQSEARELASCGSYEAGALTRGAFDEYAFSLISDDIILLQLRFADGACPEDLYIDIRDGDGKLVKIGYYCGDYGFTRAGDYVARVYRYLGDTPPYVLDYFTRMCTVCGDGVVQLESCDDGNTDDDDGCDSECNIEEETGRLTSCGDYSRLEGAYDDLRLDLDSPQTIVLETTGPDNECPGDTILEVLNEDYSVLLASDDQGGDGPCSLLTIDLQPGTYHVVVRGYEGESIGPYVLRFDTSACALCGDSIVGVGEHCDDGNTAAGDGCDDICRLELMAIGGCGQTFLPGVAANDSVMLAMSLAEADVITLETLDVFGACPADTRLEAFSGAGASTLAAADDDGGLSPCSRITLPAGPGSYRIRVSESSGNAMPPLVLRHSGPGMCGLCGNLQIDGTEECDDGDAFFVAGESCGSACLRTPCGKPTSAPDVGPSASDALHVLRTSVGLSSCDIRVCDVDASGTIVATDALTTLRAAVGLLVLDSCPQSLRRSA